MKLRKAFSKYGAQMGRPAFLPAFPETTPLTLKVWAMELDDGGYDVGGAYWGVRPQGTKIFWAESLESVALEATCRPDQGTVEMSCDAKSFKDAWQKFVKRCPLATLCPTHWEECTAERLLKELERRRNLAETQTYRIREGYVRKFRRSPLPTSLENPIIYVWQEEVYTAPETNR